MDHHRDPMPMVVAITLDARLMWNSDNVALKRAGSTTTISTRKMNTNIISKIGRITARLAIPRLGIFDGIATSASSGRIHFEPSLDEMDRLRLEDQISFISRSEEDRRNHIRAAPIHRRGTAVLNGRTFEVSIVDVSQSGLLISVPNREDISIGSKIEVGPWKGRVIRVQHRTAAIRLDEIQGRDVFIGFPPAYRR